MSRDRHRVDAHGSAWIEYITTPALRDVPTTELLVITRSKAEENQVLQWVQYGTVEILGMRYRLLAFEIIAREETELTITKLTLKQEM